MSPEPYYSDDAVTIYHGDCEDVLPTISGVDLIFTSPPYNLGASPWEPVSDRKRGQRTGGHGRWQGGCDSSGVAYEDHEDTMPWAEYVGWQREVLSLCWASLSNRGAIFYNHKPRVVGERLWLPLELNPDLPLRQIVTWARAGGMNFNPTAYVPTSEWIMVMAKPSWRLASRSASGLGDVWRVSQQPDPDHPAPFPVALPARAIDSTDPRHVLDPFMGTGSTLRAAKDSGRYGIGIERSERYCEIAAKRMAQEVLDFGVPA